MTSTMPARSYIAIDLKSFCTSVEWANRRLDQLATNLVVAEESRGEKIIRMAVSPSPKGLLHPPMDACAGDVLLMQFHATGKRVQEA